LTNLVSVAVSTTTTGVQIRRLWRAHDLQFSQLSTSNYGNRFLFTGTLNITAITFDAQGNVTSLSATFEQHCEGQTPALKGTIHYYQ
jgi:hypothetical protein